MNTCIFPRTDICKCAAHLVSKTKSQQEVAAVTFNHKKNHHSDFIYKKNKEKETAVDAESPNALEMVLKMGFSEAGQSEFLQRVVRYTLAFWPPWHQDRRKEIVDVGPVVARYV
jgi:hypothetical protein